MPRPLPPPQKKGKRAFEPPEGLLEGKNARQKLQKARRNAGIEPFPFLDPAPFSEAALALNEKYPPHQKSVPDYVGVSFDTARGAYQALLVVKGQSVLRQHFDNPIAAAQAYDQAVKNHGLEYLGKINFPTAAKLEAHIQADPLYKYLEEL